jgi:hypothetical protein
MVRMRPWEAMLAIPGAWLTNYFLGMWMQARGMGWF